MRPVPAIATAGATLVAAFSSPGLAGAAHVASATAETTPCRFLRLPRATTAGGLASWGHIRSLTRKGSRFELRFDPALWLEGTTAQRAAVEDKVIAPGEAVPNDYYVRDESHRVLTYRVPASARVTVLTNDSRGLCPTTITVSELAGIVKGGNPRHRRLFDRHNGLGYWISVVSDTVRSLDQQYQP
ncbi:MAG TPA: hypothetical protein VH572_00305 [Gaiella sp.]